MKIISMVLFSFLAIFLAYPTAMAITWEVEIENFDFIPGNLSINVGDSIEWRNRDDVSHTATSDDGLFDSGLLARDQRYTFGFTEPGVFPYHCQPHPFMRDTITVVGQTGINNTSNAPWRFKIASNYPNPFNATTMINFMLPKAGHVIVKIFNLLGQEIETLGDENMSKGPHVISWNAGENQSGVYFYRVNFDGQVLTGRMTLLK